MLTFTNHYSAAIFTIAVVLAVAGLLRFIVQGFRVWRFSDISVAACDLCHSLSVCPSPRPSCRGSHGKKPETCETQVCESFYVHIYRRANALDQLNWAGDTVIIWTVHADLEHERYAAKTRHQQSDHRYNR